MDLQQLKEMLDAVLQPVMITMLLGTGLWLTIRLGLIQFRRFAHGVAVASGKYDDPDDPGDVSHFQALTTALSATVGIGNIAGVAIAIHWGGPGALFWMWVTAVLGMATKYGEVTLAQHFREVDAKGNIAGGPMYYIEKGLGPRWKPVAMLVAGALMLTAFLSGNAIQANSIADLAQTELGVAPAWTGLVSSVLVGVVILGGIQRIGKVTSIIAPVMALLYVGGGLAVLFIHADSILPAFQLIFTEAFNPTAGVAGTGVGVFLQTMMWGIRRGLFSNEAGQGSAPIAHSAARAKEPASEGVVALIEPFIDTLVICTITGLVIISTGVWSATTPTTLALSGGDLSIVTTEGLALSAKEQMAFVELSYENGVPKEEQAHQFAWHEVAVAQLFVDAEQQIPFTGSISPAEGMAYLSNGETKTALYGQAVENGAPLTRLAYVSVLGTTGSVIVGLCVFLFGISTSISWSYYGDRCVHYLFGERGIMPYKVIYVLMHFVGAITALNVIWGLGDLVLAFVTIPNVLALVLLSGTIKKLTDRYFENR